MDRRLWIATAACAAVAWPALASAALRKPWPRGRATPALHLDTLEGAPWTPAAERGRPVLLNFWASWCEPCRSEMPLLEKFAQAHREAGLRVIAVNFRESEAAVRRFLAANALSLPVVRDSDGRAARAFGVNIFPSTVAIDRQGKTRFVAVGEVDEGELAGWIGPLV